MVLAIMLLTVHHTKGPRSAQRVRALRITSNNTMLVIKRIRPCTPEYRVLPGGASAKPRGVDPAWSVWLRVGEAVQPFVERPRHGAPGEPHSSGS